jgi:hypothetical protein
MLITIEELAFFFYQQQYKDENDVVVYLLLEKGSKREREVKNSIIFGDFLSDTMMDINEQRGDYRASVDTRKFLYAYIYV